MNKPNDKRSTVDNATAITIEGTDSGPDAPTPVSRRKFLAGGAAAGAVLVVAACGKKKSSDTTSDTTAAPGSSTGTTGGGASNDLKVASFAAGLEVLAVNTYKAALDAATANKLGPVPAAGAEFVKTAMAQHQEQLDTLNKVLKAAGQPAVTQPDAKLNPVVAEKFKAVTDFGGAAKLALLLEQIAAATYLSAIPTLEGKDTIKLAGSIQIIDMQHVAILNYVLGSYPVPDVFAKTDMAATP